MVILKQVCDPYAFGVARFNGTELAEIVEKPEHPAPSNYAVTGIYFYDKRYRMLLLLSSLVILCD